MTEISQVESPSANQEPCAKCGVAVEQPKRGHKKYCDGCRQEMQDQRSRDCHQKRRQERAQNKQCTQCGQLKCEDHALKVPLADFLGNIDPRLVNVITQEQMDATNMCAGCYAIYRLRLIEMRANKPKKEKIPGMTPAQRKERMKILGQERRERLIKEDPTLCHHCLKRPMEAGKLWCTFCLDRGVAANRRKIDVRRQNSKCVICEAPSGGQQLCGDCKKLQKKYSQKWWHRVRKERLEQNVCLRCGQAPAAEGRRACEACSDKARAYIKSRRSSGICQRCGKNPPAEDRVMCAECAAKTREYMQSKRTAPVKHTKKTPKQAKAK